MDEIEYLRSGTTVVTSSRLEIGGQTFAVRNIGSVKVAEQGGRPWGAIIAAFIGIGLGIQGDTRVAGVIVLVAAAAWAWQQMRQLSLVIVSGGGEVVALKSTDAAAIETLRAAIAQAISAR